MSLARDSPSTTARESSYEAGTLFSGGVQGGPEGLAQTVQTPVGTGGRREGSRESGWNSRNAPENSRNEGRTTDPSLRAEVRVSMGTRGAIPPPAGGRGETPLSPNAHAQTSVARDDAETPSTHITVRRINENIVKFDS